MWRGAVDTYSSPSKDALATDSGTLVQSLQLLWWRAALALGLFGVSLGACADAIVATPPAPTVSISSSSLSPAAGADDRISLDLMLTRSTGFTGPGSRS